jgi:hypothetical protein
MAKITMNSKTASFHQPTIRRLEKPIPFFNQKTAQSRSIERKISNRRNTSWNMKQ